VERVGTFCGSACATKRTLSTDADCTDVTKDFMTRLIKQMHSTLVKSINSNFPGIFIPQNDKAP
jgi:hypothetical protein